jgi:type III secretion protein T
MNAHLVRLLEEILFPLVLPFPRMLAAFSLLPLFGARALPGMVRVGVVLSLALFMHPVNAAAAPQFSAGPLFWGLILVKEVLIGLFLGFVYSWFVMALESLGSLIDTVVGNNNLSLFNPVLNEEAGPYSGLFSMFGSTYFICAGGLLLIIGGLYDSFAAWPVLTYLPAWSPALRKILVTHSADILVVTLQLAMPLLIALMMIDLALGLLNRKASEIQVFVLSLPVKTLVALSLLILLVALVSGPGTPLRRLFDAGPFFLHQVL